MNLLRVGLVLAVAVAAAVVANVVLLGVATGSSEPVGKLSPRAELVSPAPGPPPTKQKSAVPGGRPAHHERSETGSDD